MGPQTHADQLAKTLSYVETGQAEGASLMTGGVRMTTPNTAAGYFVSPAVFRDVAPSMRIAQEEIFGPVVAIIPFDTEEEAIEIANGTEYGLVAGLWSSNLARAHRVASRIEAGTVWINTYRYLRPGIPYGGLKISGLGRENGFEGIEHYLETRATVVSLSENYPDAYA